MLEPNITIPARRPRSRNRQSSTAASGPAVSVTPQPNAVAAPNAPLESRSVNPPVRTVSAMKARVTENDSAARIATALMTIRMRPDPDPGEPDRAGPDRVLLDPAPADHDRRPTQPAGHQRASFRLRH